MKHVERDIHYISDRELIRSSKHMLDEEGVTLRELKRQAEAGRFTTFRLHNLWMILDGLGVPYMKEADTL